MQTPLLFKLLLLLAVALRLIKAKKKHPKTKPLTYYLLAGTLIRPLPVELDLKASCPPFELIKQGYRKEIRKNLRNENPIAGFQQLPLASQLICVAYEFSKFYARGGMFRFLWHGNPWMIAFGQSLKFIDDGWYASFKRVVSRIAFDRDQPFEYRDIHWETVYPFPDGQIAYGELKEFEENFSFEEYLRKLTALVICPKPS